MDIKFFGEGQNTLPAAEADQANNTFKTVLENNLTTTQELGTIPSNAVGPAYLTIQADDTRVWYVSLGNASGDTLDCNDAEIKLDPVNGPQGLVLTNPQKGTVLCIADCACDSGVIRAGAAWNT